MNILRANILLICILCSYLSMSRFSSQTAVALLRESCMFVYDFLMFFFSNRVHSKEKQQLIS